MQKENHQDLHAWDAVEQAMCNARAYFTLPAQVVPFVRDEKYIGHVDSQRVHELVSALERDVGTYRGKLEQIHDRHRGRSGRARDANDHMKALEISEDYLAWCDSYQAVVLPNIEELTTIYAEAEIKLREAAEAAGVEEVLQAELANETGEPGITVEAVNEVIAPPTPQEDSANE